MEEVYGGNETSCMQMICNSVCVDVAGYVYIR